MLNTLAEAKEYAIQKIEEFTKETMEDIEKDIVKTSLEEDFFDKIEDQIDEEELEKARLSSEEDMDWYLFHKIPNYITLLEETTKNFLTEYLSE